MKTPLLYKLNIEIYDIVSIILVLRGGGEKMDNKLIGLIANILVVIGAINWGLVGIANIDLVAVLFSSIPLLQQAVYVLVGLSGLYVGYTMVKK